MSRDIFLRLRYQDYRRAPESASGYRNGTGLRFLERIEEAPEHLDIHLVMDNYGTHKMPRVKRWFARHPRYHLHLTPTGASWLNQVECFFDLLTDRRIRRGTFASVRIGVRHPRLSGPAQLPQPSPGPRTPIPSSKRLHAFGCELLTQDTSFARRYGRGGSSASNPRSARCRRACPCHS